MRSDQRPEVGGIVHLRPTTKTAGRECHAYLEVVVASYAQWPIVWVKVTPKVGEPYQIQVHADDCGLHSAKPKNQGDMQDQSTRKVPMMPGKPRPIDYGPGEEQLPLW